MCRLASETHLPRECPVIDPVLRSGFIVHAKMEGDPLDGVVIWEGTSADVRDQTGSIAAATAFGSASTTLRGVQVEKDPVSGVLEEAIDL